jgi:hypothetical protein
MPHLFDLEKNTSEASDHCKKKQFGHTQRITCLRMTCCMSILLGLPPLQLVIEKKARHTAYRLHRSNHFKKSDWGHSANFKLATEDFPVLLALSDSMLPLDVFDRKYLVEYPSRKIWLSEAEAWLPSDGLKFYTDGSLFKGGAGSGVFFRTNLISRHLSLLERSLLSFRLRFTPFWLVQTTV